jgi:hypothetical protein
VIAYQFLGCVALFAGRAAQALPALETVLQLDPQYQSRSLILADLSLSRLLLGDVDGAIAVATDAVAREPENVRAHHRLVAALGYAASPSERGRRWGRSCVCSQTSPKRMSAPPIRFGSRTPGAVHRRASEGRLDRYRQCAVRVSRAETWPDIG